MVDNGLPPATSAIGDFLSVVTTGKETKMTPEQAQQIDDALRLAEGLLLSTHAVGGDLRRIRDARDTVASLVSEGAKNALTPSSSSSTATNFNTVDLMLDECEQLQQDIITHCDGLDDTLITNLCQVVVDHYKGK